MEKSLYKQIFVIENKFLQSLGPSLNRGSTILPTPQQYCFEVLTSTTSTKLRLTVSLPLLILILNFLTSPNLASTNTKAIII